MLEVNYRNDDIKKDNIIHTKMNKALPLFRYVTLFTMYDKIAPADC